MNAETAMATRVAVASLLLAVAVGMASLLQTPRYEASAQVLVGQRSPAQEMGSGKIQLIPLAPTPETLQAITQTMIHTIDSRPVAREVIQRLGLEMSEAELLDNLTVEPLESTSFIVLTYEGTDPVQAKQIANTVGEVSAKLISERSVAGSKLRATVHEDAAVPPTQVSPDPLRNGLLTLMVGLALSVGLVTWRGVLRP